MDVEYMPAADLTAIEEHLIGHLADVMLNANPDEDRDYIDCWRAAVVALAQAMEICPIHQCDPRICADDNVTECEDYR